MPTEILGFLQSCSCSRKMKVSLIVGHRGSVDIFAMLHHKVRGDGRHVITRETRFLCSGGRWKRQKKKPAEPSATRPDSLPSHSPFAATCNDTSVNHSRRLKILKFEPGSTRAVQGIFRHDHVSTTKTYLNMNPEHILGQSQRKS